jgi:hypothetical protein
MNTNHDRLQRAASELAELSLLLDCAGAAPVVHGSTCLKCYGSNWRLCRGALCS